MQEGSNEIVTVDLDMAEAMTNEEWAEYWQAQGTIVRSHAKARAKMLESQRRSEAQRNRQGRLETGS